MYTQIENEPLGGGTNMYAALKGGLELIAENYNISEYSPAFIMMSDGKSEDERREEFIELYNAYGYDIPVFSIMFGSADDSQLNELAELTNARVFDGREDLLNAFRSVKGYN